MRSRSQRSQPARPPAVAGSFYPRDPERLRADVAGFLDAVPLASGPRPKALVVPHAGYVYSGPVAASAYARLRAPGPTLERVVLLGPSHHAAVAGLALPEEESFLTPLGAVPIDLEAAERALTLPQVTRSGDAHRREHSLEVQLPFLQAVLGRFALVPFAVGSASAAEVAGLLDLLWGGPETLVVISTDLSHYLPYDEASAMDRRTADQVLALDAAGLGREQACGRVPLQGLLLEARRRRLEVELLDLRSSGDTAGGRDQVVGYGAFAFHEPARLQAVPPRGPAAGTAADHGHRAAVATGLARATLASLFGGPAQARPEDEPWLDEPRACFVSLHRQGALRGCCGALEPRASLFEEIVRSARLAATEDGRFDPVTAAELPGLDVEVSVLSPLQPLRAADQEEAARLLRPGLDGLYLEAGRHHATFIPAVWEQLPEPGDFLRHLLAKAGLAGGWPAGIRLFRYTAERYREARA
jgi:AmmeMemoRadiSam system protein B/AmmeMemoRadiSam system protein A